LSCGGEYTSLNEWSKVIKYHYTCGYACEREMENAVLAAIKKIHVLASGLAGGYSRFTGSR